MKKLISIILVMVMFALSGCQWHKMNLTHTWEAVSIAEDFCLDLAEDLELAQEYLHHDSTPNSNDFYAFIEELERENGILFSDGVALKGIKGFAYDLGPQGSSICTYKFSIEIVVGIRPIHLTFHVRKDDNGYSIIHIEQGEWVAES